MPVPLLRRAAGVEILLQARLAAIQGQSDRRHQAARAGKRSTAFEHARARQNQKAAMASFDDDGVFSYPVCIVICLRRTIGNRAESASTSVLILSLPDVLC